MAQIELGYQQVELRESEYRLKRVTDLTMSGIDVARRVRQSRPEIPILLSTRFAPAETQRQTALGTLPRSS